nr:hypothetical protein [Angustibacter aerolatus]
MTREPKVLRVRTTVPAAGVAAFSSVVLAGVAVLGFGSGIGGGDGSVDVTSERVSPLGTIGSLPGTLAASPSADATSPSSTTTGRAPSGTATGGSLGTTVLGTSVTGGQPGSTAGTSAGQPGQPGQTGGTPPVVGSTGTATTPASPTTRPTGTPIPSTSTTGGPTVPPTSPRPTRPTPTKTQSNSPLSIELDPGSSRPPATSSPSAWPAGSACRLDLDDAATQALEAGVAENLPGSVQRAVDDAAGTALVAVQELTSADPGATPEQVDALSKQVFNDEPPGEPEPPRRVRRQDAGRGGHRRAGRDGGHPRRHQPRRRHGRRHRGQARRPRPWSPPSTTRS